MSTDYDVIVIGAGAAGEHCAAALADGGLELAIVERELVAGECSCYACIPSKMILRPGEAVSGARGAPGAAEAVTGSIDSAAVLAWRDYMVSDYDDGHGDDLWPCCATRSSRSRPSRRRSISRSPSWRSGCRRERGD